MNVLALFGFPLSWLEFLLNVLVFFGYWLSWLWFLLNAIVICWFLVVLALMFDEVPCVSFVCGCFGFYI